ncbi:alpha/beta fold hydrolase [Amycolatopsis suaedae]|uniref:Alpha/beta fold hydrolase n=1 Tax=Amycolatopsis suaedae TaxID=2510978 RepID=A0A4Q7IWZ7_9PSEU|nr:alpha/beta fold hydrolase [Amycolatopsis suaedae]RZQ59450.1 alpha/beta fold hydrolase [Amycolatopsis suaedae]
MSEQVAQVNGIELCYETFGDPADRPLLLIMGLAGPMTWWDDEFCRQLTGRGFHVIRFDNRDCGRSTAGSGHATPLAALVGRRSPYALTDMAADAAALLDRLGVASAHVVGVSMGGMIAQTLALHHPERVRSLTSMSSTTGAKLAGLPTPKAAATLLTRPPRDRDGYIEHMVGVFRVIGSPGYPAPEERLRARAEASFERGINPAGTARQLAAVLAAPDRTRALGTLRVPTLVVHGEQDPLITVSGGRATARAVPGAELDVVPGMGHDLPEALWPRFAGGIARTADRAEATVA